MALSHELIRCPRNSKNNDGSKCYCLGFKVKLYHGKATKSVICCYASGECEYESTCSYSHVSANTISMECIFEYNGRRCPNPKKCISLLSYHKNKTMPKSHEHSYGTSARGNQRFPKSKRAIDKKYDNNNNNNYHFNLVPTYDSIAMECNDIDSSCGSTICGINEYINNINNINNINITNYDSIETIETNGTEGLLNIFNNNNNNNNNDKCECQLKEGEIIHLKKEECFLWKLKTINTILNCFEKNKNNNILKNEKIKNEWNNTKNRFERINGILKINLWNKNDNMNIDIIENKWQTNDDYNNIIDKPIALLSSYGDYGNEDYGNNRKYYGENNENINDNDINIDEKMINEKINIALEKARNECKNSGKKLTYSQKIRIKREIEEQHLRK